MTFVIYTLSFLLRLLLIVGIISFVSRRISESRDKSREENKEEKRDNRNPKKTLGEKFNEFVIRLEEYADSLEDEEEVQISPQANRTRNKETKKYAKRNKKEEKNYGFETSDLKYENRLHVTNYEDTQEYKEYMDQLYSEESLFDYGQEVKHQHIATSPDMKSQKKKLDLKKAVIYKEIIDKPKSLR